MEFDNLWHIILIVGEVIIINEEFVESLFNYSSFNKMNATIVQFISTTDVMHGRLFENRYFSLIEENGQQYIIRRSIKDYVGREITICKTTKIDRILKKNVGYRIKFECLYYDLIQVIWHITVVIISLRWIIEKTQ